MGYLETFIQYHKNLGTVPSSKSLSYLRQINKNLQNKTEQDIFLIFINSQILKEKQKNKKELKITSKKISKIEYNINRLFIKKIEFNDFKKNIEGNKKNLKKEKEKQKFLTKKLKNRANINFQNNIEQYGDRKNLGKKLLKFFNNVELMRFDKIYSIIFPLFYDYETNERLDSIKPLQNIIHTIMLRYDEKSLERSVYRGIYDVLEKNPSEFISECRMLGKEISQIEKKIREQGEYKEFRKKVCVSTL